MNPWYTYWIGITGETTFSVTIPLDPDHRYLVTGGLILTDSRDYARVYISQVCYRIESDVTGCGIRDLEGDAGLGLVETLNHATSVVIKMKATGGKHRAEGVIYEL